MNVSRISGLTRILCLIGALLLVGAMFVPLWRIELDAPQYPEGLALLLYPDRIAGNVEIINGLNHYIGMKSLHSEDFIEFSVLRYIIAGFSLLLLAVSATGNRKLFYTAFFALIVFAVVSMVDFYRWNYNYGHDLNPNAAIKVPGMAYQPPLIGFKQLLNFGAYSVPDIGGWLFVACGLLLVAGVVKEKGWFTRKSARTASGAGAVLLLMTLSSCGSSGPEPIHLNTDHCTYCKMAISDMRFAAELVTEKGRVYKFDDLACLIGFMEDSPSPRYRSVWVSDFQSPGKLIDASQAWFVSDDALRSPMGGNFAAYVDSQTAGSEASRTGGKAQPWKGLARK